MDFGKAIKTVRAARGLTQEQLAEATDRDTSFISRIESGAREPSVTSLREIARALGVPFYLLTLLASGQDDLATIQPDLANRLGLDLLKVVIGLDERSRKSKPLDSKRKKT